MTKKPKKLTATQRSAISRLAGLKGGPARAKKLTAEQRSAISRLGGLKGGPARAKKLTATQRSAIARKGAKAKWYPCKKHTNNIIGDKYIKTVRNQITYFDDILNEKSNNIALKAIIYTLKWDSVHLLEYLENQKETTHKRK